MTPHAKSVAGYRTDTLEDILSGYKKKERKDRWDRERIAAITAELKRRRKEKA